MKVFGEFPKTNFISTKNYNTKARSIFCRRFYKHNIRYLIIYNKAQTIQSVQKQERCIHIRPRFLHKILNNS